MQNFQLRFINLGMFNIYYRVHAVHSSTEGSQDEKFEELFLEISSISQLYPVACWCYTESCSNNTMHFLSTTWL
jgi:hypothetical protein